jgi:hypothetical protein
MSAILGTLVTIVICFAGYGIAILAAGVWTTLTEGSDPLSGRETRLCQSLFAAFLVGIADGATMVAWLRWFYGG